LLVVAFRDSRNVTFILQVTDKKVGARELLYVPLINFSSHSPNVFRSFYYTYYVLVLAEWDLTDRTR